MKPNLLNSVPMIAPKRNAFELSHDVKLSMRMGYCVPTLCMECVPGDVHILGTQSLFRLAPLVSPMMHEVNVTHHYFYVPYRILWEGWEEFQRSLNTEINRPVMPFFQVGNAGGDTVAYTKLMDYLGLPEPRIDSSWNEVYSALPILAYQMIWQEYYRDQNLQTEAGDFLIEFPVADGLDLFDLDSGYRDLRRRAWEHDYFTSALPFAQKGQQVTIPMTGRDVPVKIEGTGPGASTWSATGPETTVAAAVAPSDIAGISDGTLYADTSQLFSSATINDLRLAYRLQEFLERDARGGTRYTEQILAHFGIKSSDARLQRPEYITGSKSPIIISEVLNTTGTTDAPQGNMAGHGVGVNSGKLGSFKCEEFGLIMCITSVMPKPAYMQGVPKLFAKRLTPADFFWPSFAHLGEQAIQNKELFAYTPDSEATFGYTPRYSEYKFQNNRVAGDFKTNLDFWTMGRKFETLPQLNAEFIECNPTDRVFAVTDPETDNIYAQVYHKITSIRPMPKFGQPMT